MMATLEVMNLVDSFYSEWIQKNTAPKNNTAPQKRNRKNNG